MRAEQPSSQWFYRRGGTAVGPVSTEALHALLVAGQIDPRQPVWAKDGLNLLFLRAAAATVQQKAARLERPAREGNKRQ
jgi:GYF domain 2